WCVEGRCGARRSERDPTYGHFGHLRARKEARRGWAALSDRAPGPSTRGFALSRSARGWLAEGRRSIRRSESTLYVGSFRRVRARKEARRGWAALHERAPGPSARGFALSRSARGRAEGRRASAGIKTTLHIG